MTLAQSNKGVWAGTVIIAGTIIGAGMFSLPTTMAGAWFFWSLFVMVVTWFCMLHSGLMLLEANLNYGVGSSFATITEDLLGRGWNIFSGFCVAFVLYILTYAYISASGSVLYETFGKLSISLSARVAGAAAAVFVAFIVWLSTAAVSRVTAIVLAAKVVTFVLTFGVLIFQVDPVNLLNSTEHNTRYMPYVLMTLPFCLASFGFHGNVPSLMKFYGKDVSKIKKSLFYGSLIALLLYTIWLYSAMGNIARVDFLPIIQKGGNIDSLIQGFSILKDNRYLDILMILFSNFAVASSFFGVTLGLFDYIADLCHFEDNFSGRFKTVLITFLPPIIGAAIWPNGFIYAIGFAGLAAAVWAVIVPALLANACRKRFNDAIYVVWGGKPLIWIVILFGLINIMAFLLSKIDLLPIYQ